MKTKNVNNNIIKNDIKKECKKTMVIIPIDKLNTYHAGIDKNVDINENGDKILIRELTKEERFMLELKLRLSPVK